MKQLVLICLTLACVASPASALIEGSSTASNCSEGGNWIDITFTTDEGVSLVDAWWDFNSTDVWLDADGSSACSPINNGVTSYNFYFDVTPGTDTQDFGSTFTGFGGGDYFRFTMDLDLGATGNPFGADMMGATLTVEFSDATVLTAVFDEPYDGSNGATAGFTNAAQPNFEFVVKPGWAGSLVPRSVNDALWTSVPAPAFLIGEADSTWLNAVYQNSGTILGGASRMDFHLDGQFLGSRNLWTIPPGDWNGSYNIGPYQVRGGRHILRVTADALNAVAESDETDNILSVQYCWQGDYLPPLATWTRPAPPLLDLDFEYGGGGSWWNCDGVRFQPSASYDWAAVWCEREADGYNYMLRLHPASDDPKNAFGTNFGASRTYEELHAVIVNTHTFGSGPWDVGVLNLSGFTDDYRIAHLHESPYPFDFGIEPSTPYTVSRLAMFQFHVGTGDLGQATLTLYSDPDDGPVHMGWLLPDFEHGNLDDLNDPVVTDAEGFARIDLNLTVTGDYCAVVYGSRDEHPSSLAVNVGLYHALPDLKPVTMVGWHAPIVPRPAPDALLLDCALPDTLHGNQPLTWMNIAGINDGLIAAPSWNFGIMIDGNWDLGMSNSVPWAPGQIFNHRNLERQGTPWTIGGGRHTLTVRTDYQEVIDECVERNNNSARQYCWSPAVLPTNASVAVTDPARLPDREAGWDDCPGGETVYWNCDGWRLPYIPPIGGNRRWCGAAVMPPTTAVNLDLQLHTALSGTQDGFGPAVLAGSFAGDGEIDFVLVNDRFADNIPHDVGVLDDVDQHVTSYDIQEVRSTWAGIAGPGEMGPYAMGADRMLNLHEFLLDPGPHLFTLKDNGTGVDWGMSLYQGGEYHGKADVVDGAMVWEAGAGVSERMVVNVPAGSTCCLAVWKVDTDELAKAGSYSLWVAPGVSDVPEDVPAPAATRIVAASPNPFNPTTTIAFELEQDGPCRLALYDLQGRLVRTLVAEDRQAGPGEAVWDGLDAQGSRVASGVYLARLQAAGTADLLKVTILK